MTTRELLRYIAEDYEEYATWDVLSDAVRKESTDLAAALRAIADRFDDELSQIDEFDDSCSAIERGVLLRLDAPVTPEVKP